MYLDVHGEATVAKINITEENSSFRLKFLSDKIAVEVGRILTEQQGCQMVGIFSNQKSKFG
jgi:hypothetical protein